MIVREIIRRAALAGLVCLSMAAIANAAHQELKRIDPPAESEPAGAFEADASYDDYQPSVFRFAEYEAEQVEQTSPQPAYGGDYGGDYCPSYGCGLAVVGGVESTFLYPILNSGNALVQIEDNFNAFTTLYRSNEVTLDDDMFFSPRIWLGMQHCSGWGIATRLFWLGDSDSNFTPDTPFFAQSHVASARLQAYTFDAELTKTWCNYYGDTRNAAFGFRYANLEAADSVEAHAVINGDLIQGFAQTDRSFDGPGFTMAYGGAKNSCGCCGVQYFFNFRGSVLWGTVRQAAQTTAFVFDPGVAGAATDFSTAVAASDDITFIGEIQLGVRWEHQLQCCCARAFVSTAVEYQYWVADGGFAATGSTAFTDDGVVTSLATAGDLELHMIGFTIGTGLTW